MPKPAHCVEYNSEGRWDYALVQNNNQGNLDLIVKSGDSGGWQLVANVPEGNASGHWRETKD